MQIRSVNIYKTPLDNSYSNVVDFINVEQNKKETLLQVFDTSYSHRQFNGLGRSIKRVGNSTLIVLPISYENGRDYNYMIIEDDEQRLFFYFITNIISENDSTINPSSTFTLEWDVWNNNIENFKDVNNTIVKKHYDRVFPVGSSRVPNFLVQFSNINIPKYAEEVNVGDRYLPLFAVLTLSELNSVQDFNANEPSPSFNLNQYFLGSDGSTKLTKIIICDGVSNRYNKNVVYLLIGLLDTHENEYVDFYGTGKGTSYYSSSGIQYTYNKTFHFDGTPELYIHNHITPYINDITFSFHCPYNYNISIDDGIITINFPLNTLFRMVDDSRLNFGVIAGDYIIGFEDGSYRYERGSNYKISELIELNYYNVTGYDNYLDDKSIYLDPSKHYLIDPITYTPPFTSIYVTYNNENLPLTVRNIYKNIFKIKTSLLSSQANFKVFNGGDFYEDEIINSPTNKFVKNSGFLSFGKNSLENYLLKNGGQIEISRLSNNLNAITNLAKFGAGVMSENPALAISGGIGVVNDLTKMLGVEASISDAERTPDEWVTNSGESDIFYQDRIRVTKEYVDRNNPAFKEFMNGIYCQGYSFPSFDTPFKNSRLSFDYVKTSGCNLSSLMINNNDKQKLEEIFDRGVTKWHIWFSNGLLKFNSSLIKDPNSLNNLEITTETNTSFHNWLYDT